MDAEVKRKFAEFTKSLRTCREMQEYEMADIALHASPEKVEKVDAFRKKNYRYQNSTSIEQAGVHLELYKEREELRKDIVIDRYLNAELVLCRLLRQISLEILNLAELHLDSLEDIL
jgi:hypothetical protein